ncbi:hypothetical protein OV207_26465 [Corallococcus sp. BB11-1]|uniref:hypothetical protein n=1 Tax=Corallococcus sp. BB11-1 TaxID=2996783 RepID=UPI002271EF5C|nr:hypothetical protein [Corallococcus sp. BB11-1]MCY1035019.1 hypothetical protein [Corallococcus sp. BB11-1]
MNRVVYTADGAVRQALLRRIVSAWVLPFAVAVSGCTHGSRPERRTYVISEGEQGIGGSGHRDCDAEHVACFTRCWNSIPPLTSIKVGSGKHHEYCTEECRKAYMECIGDLEPLPQKGDARRFSRMDEALDWLRAHRAEAAIGTVVVIAGMAFIVAAGGAGVLMLAPL